MSISKQEALFNLRPTAQWSYDATHDVLEWLDTEQTQPTDEEIQAEMESGISVEGMIVLRNTRNIKLAETDWWVLPDRNPTQAQLDYRQALRDITETYTSLDDVVWPEEPQV